MNPYKTIENQKQVIENLKFNLQHSKNKTKDAKVINDLIDTVISFDAMLKNRYYTEVIETLIYANIKEWLMVGNVYDGSEIPLKEMCSGIDFDIQNGSEQKKLEVISILKSHELENKIKNNTLNENNYVNFDELLTELVNGFKDTIKWRK